MNNEETYTQSNFGCFSFLMMLLIIVGGVVLLRFFMNKGPKREPVKPETEEVQVVDSVVAVDDYTSNVDLDSLAEKVRRDNARMDSIKKALEYAYKVKTGKLPANDAKTKASPVPAPSRSRASSANSDGFFAGYYDGYEDGMEEEHGATYNPHRGSGSDYRAGYDEGYERGFEDGLEEVARRY